MRENQILPEEAAMNYVLDVKFCGKWEEIHSQREISVKENAFDVPIPLKDCNI